jgi:hypothetical protein
MSRNKILQVSQDFILLNWTNIEIQNYDILTYFRAIWANAKGKNELGSKENNWESYLRTAS